MNYISLECTCSKQDYPNHCEEMEGGTFDLANCDDPRMWRWYTIVQVKSMVMPKCMVMHAEARGGCVTFFINQNRLFRL